MTRMIPLTNDQNSINMISAPDSNGFPASNRQGLRSLGSTIFEILKVSLYSQTLHNIQCNYRSFRYLRTNLLVKSLVTFLAVALLVPNSAQANNVNHIPTEMAIKAIMGEASNQGEKGMLAVACAIRNRGHLKGVYGVNAKHIYKEPAWVWKQARKAWETSANTDITHKATHWENVKAFGTPYWVKSMKHTVTIGDHSFYREVR